MNVVLIVRICIFTGMQFFVENLKKLQDENAEHMPIGFEVAFPSLLNIARSLNIEVPDDSPILKEIFSMRDQKLKKYVALCTVLFFGVG